MIERSATDIQTASKTLCVFQPPPPPQECTSRTLPAGTQCVTGI